MKRIVFLIFSMAGFMLQAQIIHVPSVYNKIQDGINAADPGDTVLVGDGVYYEQINFLGKKPLMVASQFLMDGDSNHIANTIIDGSQISDPDSASLVYFISGEDTTSILYGFTLTHGQGTQSSVTRSGGAIFIYYSGSKIVHNHITGNHVNDTLLQDPQWIWGAGICAVATADYWTVIDQNVIDQNSCYSQMGASGGGIRSANTNIKITNNIIAGNACSGDVGAAATGASFACFGQAKAIVQHNTIQNNISQAINNYANSAGGYFVYVTGRFADNIVENNEVITWQSTGGVGGLYILNPGEGMVVRNNLFKNNVSNLYAGALCLESNDPNSNQVLVENNYFLGNSALNGGAFVAFNVPVVFQNNIFMGNNANAGGGAMVIHTSAEQAVIVNNVFSGNNASVGGAINMQCPLVQQNHLAILINNSFSGNSAVNFGGAFYTNKAMPLILNTNFYGNEAAIGQEIYLNHYLDTLDMAYSNVDPGKIYGNVYFLESNINEDPGFLDDTCHIDQYSLCEDHGADSIYIDGTWYYAPISDYEGSPRPYHMGIDIGADECDIIDNIPDPGINIDNLIQVQSYPNPFTNYTFIEYELEHSANVNLSIYNYLGQRLELLADGEQEAGRHQVQWNAEGLPAGVYFYRLTSGSHSSTGKMAVVR